MARRHSKEVRTAHRPTTKETSPELESLRQAIHRLHRRRRDAVIETGHDWAADAALLIPAIHHMRRGTRGMQAVVLVGSGEAVRGVAEESSALLRRGREFRVVLLHPDDDARREVRKVTSAPDVIVTTPARLIDHIRRNNIDLSDVTSCTIDATSSTNVEQFDADLHFIYTKLTKRPVTTAFVSKLGHEGEGLMDLLRRPAPVAQETWRTVVGPAREPKQERCMADKKRPFDEGELKAKIKEIIRAIHETEDPVDLNAYKRFIKRHVSIFTRAYFTAFLLKYAGAPVPSRGRRKTSTDINGDTSSDKTSIFVSIGRNRRVHARDLIVLFTSADGVTSADIGPVKVLDNYSFVEIEPGKAKQAIDSLNGSEFRGRKITVNFARKK